MTDIVADAASLGAASRTRASAWKLFLGLIAIATLLPMIAVPYAQYVIPGTGTALALIALLNFLGANFHVAATGWFYADPTMRPHFTARPLRYFVVPVLLTVGAAAAFQLVSPSKHGYLLVPFFCWQLWHYQKQNIGVLSFIAAGTDRTPLSVWERRCLTLGAVAGILGFFKLSPFGGSVFAEEFAQLHRLGGALYLLAPLAIVIAIVRTPSLRRNRLRLVFLLLGTAFFAPTFIFADQVAAVLGYTVAHGLQYLVFMGVVSTAKPRPILWLGGLLLLALVGGMILNAASLAYLAQLAYSPALYGASIGAVMAHFIVDADIWRLREPFQRKYMRERFHFVFSR